MLRGEKIMKKIAKIIAVISLLFLIMGIVSATDINDLKCPDGWKALGGGSYHEEGDSAGQGSGQNMMIQKWDDSFKEEYYENNTEEQYTVTDTGNNTYMYIDDYNQNAGSFEVVEIDGVKYFVNFFTTDNMDVEEIADTSYFMQKFNELNNLEAVEV